MEEAGDHQMARDCFADRASLFRHVHCALSLVLVNLLAHWFWKHHAKISGQEWRKSVRISLQS